MTINFPKVNTQIFIVKFLITIYFLLISLKNIIFYVEKYFCVFFIKSNKINKRFLHKKIRFVYFYTKI